MQKIITDFALDSTVKHLWPPEDLSGLTFQIQFAGHEFVGPRYYVHRDNLSSFLLAFTPKGHTNILVNNEPYCANENTLIFNDCSRPFTSTTDLPVPPEQFVRSYITCIYIPTTRLRAFSPYLPRTAPLSGWERTTADSEIS